MDKGELKKLVNKTEKAFAKRLGGYRCPASGATDYYKGDIIDNDEELLIDLKTTQGVSVSVTLKMLNKISMEAREAGFDPAILLHYFECSKLIPQSWILIPLEKYEEMKNQNV